MTSCSSFCLILAVIRPRTKYYRRFWSFFMGVNKAIPSHLIRLWCQVALAFQAAPGLSAPQGSARALGPEVPPRGERWLRSGSQRQARPSPVPFSSDVKPHAFPEAAPLHRWPRAVVLAGPLASRLPSAVHTHAHSHTHTRTCTLTHARAGKETSLQ